MSQTNWEADKMLDVYIYDYFVKRKLQATANAFQAEGKVSSDPVAIDAPGGFLFEWWSVFWDIFIARTNEKHSAIAASYIETQLMKAREQQQQNNSQQPSPHQQLPQQITNQSQNQPQLQMQQMLLQRQQQHHQNQQQQQQQQQPPQQQNQNQNQQQQQRRDGPEGHLVNGATGLVGGTANALATKMYEERLKLPLQRDSMDEASLKRFSENVGPGMDPSHASLLKSSAAGQSSGQVLHGTSGGLSGTLQQVQSRNQQLPGPAVTIKTEMNSVLTPRPLGPEGPLMGVQAGPNQPGSNLTLKGWPLTGLEQLRTGILHQQKPFMQSTQPFHQMQQFLTPHQQHLLLQAQQNLSSPNAGAVAATNDVDGRRLRMLMNNRSMVLGKDGPGQPNPMGGDIVPSVSSTFPAPVAGMEIPGNPDIDMIIKKKIVQLQQQQQHQSGSQLQQPCVSSQQSQNSNPLLPPQDKTITANGTVDGSMPASFRADQVSKTQSRKRKQPVSSGHGNSSGNTAGGPSPSSAPSTPSTHTPGDVMSMPQLPHTGSSKPLMVFGSDGTGSLTSPGNQLADMDRFVEDGSLDDNVESFLSHDEIDPRETMGRGMDVSKGFTFNEIGSTRASSNKVVCCHFSSDGKLLATGGHDKKAVLWYVDSLKPKSTLEEHSLLITDVRFSPSMPRLATSSFDRTVRVWDADNQGYSLRTFTGHSASAMSLDFHPNKEDLICSCDGDGEVRYWSINNGSCIRVFKGGTGTTQMRFQPRQGKYLAAAGENLISILDVETQAIYSSLQGHTKHVDSVCWDPSGDYLASVSEDSVRVWSFGAGGEGECVHELTCVGNKFHSCVFHPTFPSLLVIGCYQSLELWDMREGKTMTLNAHEGLIAALAVSNMTGLIASASHDKLVKLWK